MCYAVYKCMCPKADKAQVPVFQPKDRYFDNVWTTYDIFVVIMQTELKMLTLRFAVAL